MSSYATGIFSTPAHVSFGSIASNFTMEFYCMFTGVGADVFPPLIVRCLMSTLDNEVPSGFAFNVAANGTLSFLWVDGGSIQLPIFSTEVAPFVIGSYLYVKVEVVVVNGEAYFYTSTDGVTWTQLGDVVEFASFDEMNASGDTPLVIAARSESANIPFIGRWKSATVRNTASEVVAFPNPSVEPAGATAFTDTTDKLWTGLGAAAIVADAAATRLSVRPGVSIGRKFEIRKGVTLGA